MAQRYLLNRELLEKLEKIEKVAEDLRHAVEENNEAHRKLYEEFTNLIHKEDAEINQLKRKFTELYKKYFVAKNLFDSE